jgi:5'-3' exonuclease
MTHDTTLALIDVSHIFRSSWAASGDQNLSAAHDYTMKAIKKIAWSSQYNHTIICCDAPPYKRADFFPEYKANREKPDHQMVEQMKRVMRSVAQLGLKVARAQGYEADDCIATLVTHAEALGWLSTIYSADKDLMQLISPKTRMVSTRNGDIYDEAAVFAKRGVWPKDIVTQLALEGDSSDNIPGVPGIGPKTAAKWIAEYGTLENIIASDIGGAAGVALREHQNQALVSAVLVELDRKVPLVWGELTDKPQKTREPIVNEETQVEEKQVHPVVPIARSGEPEVAHPAEPGDKLVGGALKLQDSAPEHPEPGPISPGIARADRGDDIEGIELRPGLTMSRGQFQLLRKLAHYFWEGDLYRRKFENESAIFTILELGLELGLSPQIALHNFEIIEGRPAPGAHYLMARAMADASCVYFEMIEENFEVEDPFVTYETKSRASGRVKTFTYRMSDAEAAGVVSARSGKKTTWQSRPREMLRKTAGSQAARLWYPAACAGLYSMEELGVLPGEIEQVA